jgi:hypothetical protein
LIHHFGEREAENWEDEVDKPFDKSWKDTTGMTREKMRVRTALRFLVSSGSLGVKTRKLK